MNSDCQAYVASAEPAWPSEHLICISQELKVSIIVSSFYWPLAFLLLRTTFQYMRPVFDWMIFILWFNYVFSKKNYCLVGQYRSHLELFVHFLLFSSPVKKCLSLHYPICQCLYYWRASQKAPACAHILNLLSFSGFRISSLVIRSFVANMTFVLGVRHGSTFLLLHVASASIAEEPDFPPTMYICDTFVKN